MFADFFTMPLQWSLFRPTREVIMVWAHVNILQDYEPPPNKELIEKNISGDKPETSQKATYVHVVTGNQIEKTDGTE